MKLSAPQRYFAAILLGVALVGGVLAGRSLGRKPLDADRSILNRPAVIADIVTYQPLLDDMDLLAGEDGLDFTRLTDAEWAVLLKERNDANRAQ